MIYLNYQLLAEFYRSYLNSVFFQFSYYRILFCSKKNIKMRLKFNFTFLDYIRCSLLLNCEILVYLSSRDTDAIVNKLNFCLILSNNIS